VRSWATPSHIRRPSADDSSEFEGCLWRNAWFDFEVPYWVFKHPSPYMFFIIDESLGRGQSFPFHLMQMVRFTGDPLALSASMCCGRGVLDIPCALEARHLLVNQRLPACLLALRTSGQAHRDQDCEGRPARKRHILMCAARVGMHSYSGRDGIERRGRIYKNINLSLAFSVYDI
jgi:hypothetical protein